MDKKLSYLSCKVNISGIPTTLKYVAQGCNLFFNAQHLLLQLNSMERTFYDFTLEQMDTTNNGLCIDSSFRTKFCDFVNKITSGQKTISETLPHNALKKLVRLGLLIKTSKKSIYIVNPKYAFKSTKAKRIELLKELIEQSGLIKVINTKALIGLN